MDTGREYENNPCYWHQISLFDGSPAWWPAYFLPLQTQDGSRCVMNANNEIFGKIPGDGVFFDQTLFPYADGYPSTYSELDKAMKRVLWGACPRIPW